MGIWTVGFPSDQQAPNFLHKMFRMNLALKDCFLSTTSMLAFYGDKGIIGYKEKLSARSVRICCEPVCAAVKGMVFKQFTLG